MLMAVAVTMDSIMNPVFGTPTGTDPSVAKAMRVSLGTTGTGLYVNSATGYSGNLADLRINAVSVWSVSNTAITTSLNYSQTGAGTCATGSGRVRAATGMTELYLQPGTAVRVVDGLAGRESDSRISSGDA